MDAFGLKSLLLGQLEDVLIHLLPAGKRHGNYYHVGSVQGEEGNSLRVCLSGNKRGVWCDGAEAGMEGDIIDLWTQVKNYGSFKEALPDIKGYLGVTDHKMLRPSRKRYTEPPKDYKEEADYSYLEGRGIPKNIARTYGVCSHKDKKHTLAFVYKDEKQNVRMIKYLKAPSLGMKKQIWCSPDSKPILFGMHLNHDSRFIVITEGEIDAMSFAVQGIPAVSVPFGAKGEDEEGSSPNDEWISNCYDWLEQFETIYLCMDNDAPGKEATEAIVPRLGRERVKVIDLPQKYKDANEALLDGRQLTDFLQVAQNRDPADLTVGSALMDKVWHTIRKGPREQSGIKFMDWDFEDDNDFRIRPREGTVVTGFSHGGKSNLIYQLFSWLACKHDHTCFIGSYEESADSILGIITSHIHGRHLDKTEYKVFKDSSAIFDKFIMHEYEGTLAWREFFNYARYAVKRYGCTQVFLDGISSLDVDLDDKKETALFTKAAQSFWKETGSHLWASAHPRKAFNETLPPLKLDVKGSGYLTDLFSNVVTVHRPPRTADLGHQAEFIVSKQKVGGRLSRTELYYDTDSYRLYQDYKKEVGSWAAL